MSEQELDFGASRRAEAQLAMRFVVGSLAKEHPYAGSRLASVLPEFADGEAAADWFKAALYAFVQGLGAEVQELEEYQELGAHVAPSETLVISGMVPGQALAGGLLSRAPIVEACSEVLRVLLGTAIVGAFEDAEEDERVIVVVRSIELGSKVDLETQNTTGLARFRGIVICERAKQASYLLGSCVGQPKPQILAWSFPFVEMVYGRDRLHWQDLRSPGYDAAATVEQQTSRVPS